MKIYNGYGRLPRNYTLMSDEYEFTMGNGYLMNNKQNEEAVFDVFFRKIPNGGGYAVMAGIDKIIPYIQNLKFDEKELDYFRRKGYPDEFLNYLRNFKFTGDIYAIPDGTPVFPNEPIVTVKAPLIEAQIVETAILSIVNGAMEHATGARRIIEATPNNVGVMEFGARRADGCEAAIDASIYGIMAGCIGTSNILAADMLSMKAIGTQAHSWIESYPTEYDAFLSYAKVYPNNCILLVDTIDTLRSGIPNAIKVFKYMKDKGMNVDNIGVRIDSGDLAYLSKETRKMLDEAGFPQAKICLSNGLTAETIESLINQGAKFDSLGVGDNISKPEGRMGCVYKEVALKEGNEWIPKIKLSNDTVKIINPDYKKLYRAYDKKTGYAIADIMTRRDEKISTNNLTIISITDFLKRTTISNFELVELQKPIFINGELVYDDPEIMEKQKYCNEQMSKLYPEIKRTKVPHEYYVDGTEDYINFKNNMIINAKKIVKENNIREEKIQQLKQYIEELKTINFSKLEKDGEFISIETYKCNLNNGNEITREKILKNKKDGSAAITVAMTENKEFILAIEPRVFTKETVDVGLPAGYIEENELPIEAAKREVLEETGYQANELVHLGSFYQDQGCSAACNHYFLAPNCKKIKEQNLDDGEFIKYILVDYEELKWLIDNGYINGINSAYAIEKAMKLINEF